MNVFYEEDGGFKVGRVMEDIGTSLQVEAVSGKRSKIKAGSVLLRFESPVLAEFMPQAERVAAGIDPDFLWQVCGAEEFGFEDLAREYVGRVPTAPEAAGVAVKLHASPIYFYKKGKGRYKAAPEENLKAALASVERKKREAAQMADWVAQLVAGTMPDDMRSHINTLLYKPDRNTLMWKACEEAIAQSGTPLAKLFFRAGAWPDRDNAPHEYHLGRFLAEYFPRGIDYTGTVDAAAPAGLTVAEVNAFSIDDAATTEIDDAFSVRTLPSGDIEIGVHIAAPALFFSPGSELDKLAAQRLSTVYHPAGKITMLPDAAVAMATLAEGRACPALSFYATFAADTLEYRGARSAIEAVPIASNLRIGEVETYFHDDAVAAGNSAGPFGAELILLHRIAKTLATRRGKGDNEVDRIDYNFDIAGGRVNIVPRRRGSPVDTVVAEFMIFVNSEWGKLLADNGVAGIYRAQANMKTRMTTDALPHEGLGVAQYAWSSSPLRRYVDLVNQRQLVAFLRSEPPGFVRRSRDSMSALNEIARRFDVTYDAYAEFQRGLEKYWCLRYLEQEGLREFDARIIRDELVRAETLPLIVKLDKNPELPGKSPLRVAVDEIDYWEIGGRFSRVIADENS
jgi:exoribonuclease-2